MLALLAGRRCSIDAEQVVSSPAAISIIATLPHGLKRLPGVAKTGLASTEQLFMVGFEWRGSRRSPPPRVIPYPDLRHPAILNHLAQQSVSAWRRFFGARQR
jgi:hypothetical protein